MQNFTFQTANTIVVEAGATKRLGKIVADLGVRRPIVVTDQGIVKAGLLQKAVEGLKEAGLEVCTFEKVQADPPAQNVLDAVSMAKEFAADGVVGLGGGSSMDVAKVTSFLTLSTQTLEQLYESRPKGKRLPLVQVPTTAGTGSEVTNVAVISAEPTVKKGVLGPQLLPDVAVLDPELTLGLPPHVTASTGMDAMVHAIEAYTVRVRRNPISDALAREAMRILAANIKTAVADGSNIEARSNMLLGAMYAGQAFGNAMTAGVHAFAHALGGQFHIPHGLANSIMLPHIMRFNLATSKKEYAELARVVLPDTAGLPEGLQAERFIGYLEELPVQLAIETKLSQVGVREEQLPMMATEVLKEDKILYFNPRKVTYDDALSILTAAL